MSHALGSYLGEVRRHPLLTPQEELVASPTELVRGNLRLVIKIARDLRPAELDLLDLIQEGNVGLVQAAERFDPSRGVRFATFAAWWIRALMLRYILDNLRSVKLGSNRHRRHLFFNLRKEQQRLRKDGLEVEADLGEVAKAMGMSEEEVRAMDVQLSSSDVALDGHAIGEVTRVERLVSLAPAADEIAERHEVRRIVSNASRELAARLRGRDQVIYCRRWLEDEPPTLAALGHELGISRERTRQVERRLLGRLRLRLETRLA